MNPPVEDKRLRLSAMLFELADAHAGGRMIVGDLVDRAAHAGFGFVIGILALVSIPFVGLSTPFGIAIAVVAAQMLFGRERPWVPGWLRRQMISADTLLRLSRRLARWTRWLERIVRPRWVVLVRGPLWPLVGFGIVVLALGLALPLPIPGSNAIFIAPILVYAVGLLEDDGALIFVGHAATLANIALAAASWVLVRNAVMRVVHWLM